MKWTCNVIRRMFFVCGANSLINETYEREHHLPYSHSFTHLQSQINQPKLHTIVFYTKLVSRAGWVREDTSSFPCKFRHLDHRPFRSWGDCFEAFISFYAVVILISQKWVSWGISFPSSHLPLLITGLTMPLILKRLKRLALLLRTQQCAPLLALCLLKKNAALGFAGQLSSDREQVHLMISNSISIYYIFECVLSKYLTDFCKRVHKNIRRKNVNVLWSIVRLALNTKLYRDTLNRNPGVFLNF